MMGHIRKQNKEKQIRNSLLEASITRLSYYLMNPRVHGSSWGQTFSKDIKLESNFAISHIYSM